MRPNPEPNQRAVFQHAHCTPVKINAGGIDRKCGVNLLESQGWMLRILAPEMKSAPDFLSPFQGGLAVELPELLEAPPWPIVPAGLASQRRGRSSALLMPFPPEESRPARFAPPLGAWPRRPPRPTELATLAALHFRGLVSFCQARPGGQDAHVCGSPPARSAGLMPAIGKPDPSTRHGPSHFPQQSVTVVNDGGLTGFRPSIRPAPATASSSSRAFRGCCWRTRHHYLFS